MADDYQGFCLKCKTYGPLGNPQIHKMSNGRTRVAGICQQEGCSGNMSKIIG